MSKVKGFDALFNTFAFILQAGQIEGHKISFTETGVSSSQYFYYNKKKQKRPLKNILKPKNLVSSIHFVWNLQLSQT